MLNQNFQQKTIFGQFLDNFLASKFQTSKMTYFTMISINVGFGINLFVQSENITLYIYAPETNKNHEESPRARNMWRIYAKNHFCQMSGSWAAREREREPVLVCWVCCRIIWSFFFVRFSASLSYDSDIPFLVFLQDYSSLRVCMNFSQPTDWVDIIQQPKRDAGVYGAIIW